jgi:RHS repeat-associated protein
MRLSATRNGAVTQYIYDAGGNPLAEADASNTITRYYIHGGGLLSMITAAGEAFTYHYNELGSTIAITDASEMLVSAYSYDPFGGVAVKTEGVGQPFKFVGRHGVMDEPGGLQYMRARYYDPALGRFISEDPAGFGGGQVNLYAYVGNNPVGLIDPSGLREQSAQFAGDDFRSELRLIAATPRGGQMFEEIQARSVVTLHRASFVDLGSGYAGAAADPGPTVTFGGSRITMWDVYVPRFPTMYDFDRGVGFAHPARRLAHELGHTAGYLDDGDGNMNNVNANENTIGRYIDGRTRLSY